MFGGGAEASVLCYAFPMTKLEDIAKAVEQLSPDELAKFRDWFEELQAQQWDQQIEADTESGKLDALTEKWRADYEAGQHTELKPPRR